MAQAQGSNANVASVPAPLGGWNHRDNLSDMAPQDAVVLQNFFCSPTNVVLRGGYSVWASGITGTVESLMSYSGGNTSKFFAAAGASIYDVTAGGAVGAAVVAGQSSAQWQYVNVTTTGGNFMYAVNGVDSPLLYDGTTWTSITAVSTPAITGVTSSTLINVELFKNRLWFIQKDTLKCWYLPTSAVGGAAQVLDLSSIARLGGKLVGIATWTIDAGYGVDDNLVFLTDKGEAIVYSGTDPSSATTFALIGVWIVGEPLGYRSMMKYGGDVLLLTRSGLMPLAASLQSSRLDPRVSLTDKIAGAFAQATTDYKDNYGWEIIYNAANNALWVNVPVATGAQQQYVMNNITKAWSQFVGWDAVCWENFNQNPYFGGDGFVGKAWTTDFSDNGINIETQVIQAFSYFDLRGVKKYFTRARPSIFTNGTPAILVGMNVDFDVSNTTAALSYSAPTGALWDTAVWDTAVWAAGTTVQNNWQGITGIGYCGGIQLRTASQGISIEWASTDVVYQTGWPGI